MTRMIVTPVRSSPAMIARSIGAAPRQRGSSDGCTFSSSSSDEQRLADQLAEGAHDPELGLGGPDPLASDSGASVASVRSDLDPELLGGRRGGRRGEPAAAAPRGGRAG